MYPLSAAFEQFLQKRSRTWNLKADIDGTEYGTNAIISFDIENSIVSSDEFEIGTAIVSKLVLRMRTVDELPPNAKVIPYVSLSLSSMTWDDADWPWADADWPWAGGDTDWMPLGEFYIDTREKANNVWTYTCLDKLMFANVPYISSLTYPATMQDVWDEICDSLDYTYDSTVTIDPSYQIEVGPAGYSKRQVLAYIAAANSASVYVGKDGMLKFRRFTAADVPVYDMGTSDYVRAIQTNPVKTYTRVVVTYDDEGAFYAAGIGDDNHTLYLENPFATQEIVDDLLMSLNGFAYMPIRMDARGYPQIEAGDRLGYIRNESLTWDEANFTWDDADIPWDGNQTYQTIALHTVFGFNGGLKMSIEAPSKSDQQSEFQVDGTLTTAVNRLNQTAVKQGKPYFGVTITKEQGLIIERSDHASKAVFNSDELTFYRGTEKALWFDVPSGVYKFSGTIEASEFIGGSIQIGSSFSVDNTGHMIATGALIQSSSGYPKVVLNPDSNQFGVYASPTNYIFFDPTINPSFNAPEIGWRNSGEGANAYLTASLFNIQSTTDISLETSDGIYLLGGYVFVPNWSAFRSIGESQTLLQYINGIVSGYSGIVVTPDYNFTYINGLLKSVT